MSASGWRARSSWVKPTGMVDLMTMHVPGFTARAAAATASTVEVSKWFVSVS